MSCIKWELTSWGRKNAHLNKENEMLEGSVEVSLLLQLHHRVKVLVVDVSVDPEQALQDGFGHRHEVLWKRDSCGSVKNKNEMIQYHFQIIFCAQGRRMFVIKLPF